MEFKDFVRGPDNPKTAEDVEAARRKALEQANASIALEGLVVDAEDLALQERIIKGEITTDEASALLIEKFRKES
jgi:hypothetical protein